MGRPALNVRQISVQLTPEIYDRLTALVGSHHRSVFIRQAIEKALDEAEKPKPSTPTG